MSDTEAILRWLVALSLVSFAVAPLTWWLGEGLSGARYGLTRPLGIILVTAVLWWPAALAGVPFVRLTLVLVVLLLGIAGWSMWWRGPRELNWRSLAVYEVLWLVLFGGYALFRSYNPDIANTEKPMEIALLSSVSRSADVPAPDPWFAGEAINYYYFGYQVIASLVKLTGVPTSIAFNLALATLFASLGTAAAAAGYRLAIACGLRRSLASLSAAFATFLLLVAGNLEAAIRLVRNPAETIETGWWYDGVGWQASRVIVDLGVHGSPDPKQTINEFPAFSFILGDLHPHVLTYPLLLAITTLLVGIACAPTTATSPRIAAIGSLIGLLYVSNSWDAPLGFLLLTAALVVALGWRQRGAWLNVGLAAIAVILTAVPFLLHFTAPVGVDPGEIPGAVRSIPVVSDILQTLGIVTWRPSSAVELLTVHGHWLVAFTIFAVFALGTQPGTRDAVRRRFDLFTVTLLFALVLAVLWVPAVILLGVPFVLAMAISVWDSRQPVRVVAVLFATGFFLTVIPEFVYIQDAFGDRMNTVFKLYFQAWLLFSLASAAGFAIVLANSSRRAFYPSAVLVVALIVSVAPYTPLSARDWTGDYADRRGLDGAGYLTRSAPDEAAAIDWLHKNASAGTVIVESPGCSYGTLTGLPMNRMSAFTGVPTIVGWAGHEGQWRRGESNPIRPRVEYRQNVANRWLSGENARVPNLPEPDYIVLGAFEASGSDTCESVMAHDIETSIAALDAFGWRAAFITGSVVILSQNTAESGTTRD
ncbi:DUF2298 domain-containing protein [soil metagenome]